MRLYSLSKLGEALAFSISSLGELVPQDRNDEPASILLKLISSEIKKKTRVAESDEFDDNLKQTTLNSLGYSMRGYRME